MAAGLPDSNGVRLQPNLHQCERYAESVTKLQLRRFCAVTGSRGGCCSYPRNGGAGQGSLVARPISDDVVGVVPGAQRSRNRRGRRMHAAPNP